MARVEGNHILAAVRSALPEGSIRSLASELGVVRRQRKVDIVALVHALVLGFSATARRTLSGLRRSYALGTGERLAASSFYARFTPAFVALMKTLTERALETISESAPRPRGVFGAFRDVLAIDSSLIRLHDALEGEFPSVWTNHTRASAKLGMIVNVVGRSPHRIEITHGSRHDIHLLEPGPWMKRRLFVFDLGFFGAQLFQKIGAHGGYFLTRMRKHGNPVILRSFRSTNERIVGRRMRDVLESTRARTLDVEAEMVFQEHLDVIKTRHACFRFVAVFHAETETWHRYVTNVPADILPAEHVSAAYAARWEIELLFRELKQRFRVDHVPTRRRPVAEALLYAAILSLIVSRRVHRLVVRSLAASRKRLPLDRWSMLFETVALALLVALLAPRGRRQALRALAAFLVSEAADPNRKRLPLDARAQLGLLASA